MRLLFAFVIVAAAALAAEPAAPKKPPTPAQAATAKPPKPVEIPAGAVETEPSTYRYTDAQGKKWIYRRTPFGVARLEDKGDAAAKAEASAPADNATATADGEYIRFERPSPFGPYKWQKKKTELDENERAIWDRAQAQAGEKRK